VNLRKLFDLSREVRALKLQLFAKSDELRAAHAEIARLKSSVDYWKEAAADAERGHRAATESYDRELRRLAEALDQRIVPMPRTPLPDRDRENCNRLAEENARLRALLDKERIS